MLFTLTVASVLLALFYPAQAEVSTEKYTTYTIKPIVPLILSLTNYCFIPNFTQTSFGARDGKMLLILEGVLLMLKVSTE